MLELGVVFEDSVFRTGFLVTSFLFFSASLSMSCSSESSFSDSFPESDFFPSRKSTIYKL